MRSGLCPLTCTDRASIGHGGHEHWTKSLYEKAREAERIANTVAQRKVDLVVALAEEERLVEWRLATQRSKRAQATLRSISQSSSGRATRSHTPSSTSQFSLYSSHESCHYNTCVAHFAGICKDGLVRCTHEASHGSLQCRQHTDECIRAKLELRTVKGELRIVARTVHHARNRSEHTLSMVAQAIAAITRFLALEDAVKTMIVTTKRLEGYHGECCVIVSRIVILAYNMPQAEWSQSSEVVCTGLYGLNREVVASLLARLEGARSELLRSKAARAMQGSDPATPTGYSQLSPYQTLRTTRTTLPQHPFAESESGGRPVTLEEMEEALIATQRRIMGIDKSIREDNAHYKRLLNQGMLSCVSRFPSLDFRFHILTFHYVVDVRHERRSDLLRKRSVWAEDTTRLLRLLITSIEDEVSGP